MDSATIARMIARSVLISVLVVASKSSHKLLPIGQLTRLKLRQELERLLTAQSNCNSTAVKNLDIAVLSRSICEPEITCE
jgi:hypothetical protein